MSTGAESTAPRFRVIMPNGDRSRLYTAEQIEAACSSSRIPASAMVEADGIQVTIAAFRNGIRPTAFVRGRLYPRVAVFLAKCIMAVAVLIILGEARRIEALLVAECGILFMFGVVLYTFGRWAADTTSQLNAIIARLGEQQRG